MSALCSQWCWTAYGCRGGCCSGCSRAAAWAQGTTSPQSKQCRLPTCNMTAAASELCMPWHSHGPPAGFPLRPVLATAWRCCPATTCCQQAPMPLAGVLKARAGAACRRAAPGHAAWLSRSLLQVKAWAASIMDQPAGAAVCLCHCRAGQGGCPGCRTRPAGTWHL